MFTITKAENNIIHMSGIFDSSCAEKAKEVLYSVTSSCTLDCSGLDYISSAGLGVLIATYKHISENGGEIELINVGDNIKNILFTVHFEKFFNIS